MPSRNTELMRLYGMILYHTAMCLILSAKLSTLQVLNIEAEVKIIQLAPTQQLLCNCRLAVLVSRSVLCAAHWHLV